MITRPVVVGMSAKMYFTVQKTRAWCEAVSRRLRHHPALLSGAVEVFFLPTHVQIPTALAAFEGTRVRVGAQDLAAHDSGAFTGEVSGGELAELGCTHVEVGHAERRRLFAESDDVVAAKTAVALRNGLRPVLCVGELDHQDIDGAASSTTDQITAALRGAPPGPVTIAYEPVWAIGAAEPAPMEHVKTMGIHLTRVVGGLAGRAGSDVIYGGAAAPGLLTTLDGVVDGVFLGRFAHDPDRFVSVVEEAAAIAARATPRPA